MAITLPPNEPVPGGIAVVRLESHGTAMPAVKYEGNRVLVVRNQQDWYAIVGIPLETKPGNQLLQVSGMDSPLKFTVNDKQYETQRITIKDKRKVEPNKEDLQRINRESKRIDDALEHWSDQPPATLDFIMPVTGKLSSPFGLRRFFNNLPRKPHSGVDIAVPQGTPVKAPLAGDIIETGNFFFNGNSIFIEHGQGLVSMYCHLDTIKVKKGQHVLQGDIIGTSGMTGRATGPHLHWGISLNNARIDPFIFLPQQTSQLHE
jgi:murein DD-endopeptidase MepM/ murein hydrolase activator NlpD